MHGLHNQGAVCHFDEWAAHTVECSVAALSCGQALCYHIRAGGGVGGCFMELVERV